MRIIKVTNLYFIFYFNNFFFQYGPRYEWSQPVQGNILGAYFWGYVPASLFGGWISERIGPFHVLFWSHVVIGILNSISVYGVYIHYALLIVCRILIGVGAVSFM